MIFESLLDGIVALMSVFSFAMLAYGAWLSIGEAYDRRETPLDGSFRNSVAQ